MQNFLWHLCCRLAMCTHLPFDKANLCNFAQCGVSISSIHTMLRGLVCSTVQVRRSMTQANTAAQADYTAHTLRLTKPICAIWHSVDAPKTCLCQQSNGMSWLNYKSLSSLSCFIIRMSSCFNVKIYLRDNELNYILSYTYFVLVNTKLDI